jgi:hypothetical protein
MSAASRVTAIANVHRLPVVSPPRSCLTIKTTQRTNGACAFLFENFIHLFGQMKINKTTVGTKTLKASSRPTFSPHTHTHASQARLSVCSLFSPIDTVSVADT